MMVTKSPSWTFGKMAVTETKTDKHKLKLRKNLFKRQPDD
jgi:hypothetical protein